MSVILTSYPTFADIRVCLAGVRVVMFVCKSHALLHHVDVLRYDTTLLVPSLPQDVSLVKLTSLC